MASPAVSNEDLLMRLMNTVLPVLALSLLAGAAQAESVRDRQERACQADAMKFCRDYVPDEDKIATCMGQHRSELSVNCGIMYDAGMRKK
jgi:type II secretory pathway component PulL